MVLRWIGANTVCHKSLPLKQKPVAALRHVFRTGGISLMIPKNAAKKTLSYANAQNAIFFRNESIQSESRLHIRTEAYNLWIDLFRVESNLLASIPTAYQDKTLQFIESITFKLIIVGLLPKQYFQSNSKKLLQTRTEVIGNKSIGVLKGNVLNPFQTQMTCFSISPRIPESANR